MDEDEVYRIFQTGQESLRQSLVEGDTLRVAIPRSRWEYLHTEDLNEAVARAIELGWAENKVQVKKYQVNPELTSYYIEPFEEDCTCPNLLKYADFALAE